MSGGSSLGALIASRNCFFWMLSAPSEGLSAGVLALWMGFAIIGFFSAQTMFIMPHTHRSALADQMIITGFYEIFAARAGWIAVYFLRSAPCIFLFLLAGKNRVPALSMPTILPTPVCLPPAACWLCMGLCADANYLVGT